MIDSKPVLIETTGAGAYQVAIAAQGPTFFADEPESVGGQATGPTPYEMLSGALGACTAMTMQMYARRKGLPVSKIQIAVAHSRDPATGRDRFDRQIYIEGPLEPDQTTRLMEIAERCPVGKTLSGGADLTSRRVDAPCGRAHEPPRDCMHEPAMLRTCEAFEATG